MELSEIIEHLDKDPEALNGVLSAVKEKGYNIRTSEEETTYRERLSKQIEDEKISPRIKEIYSQIDKDFSEVTGLEKEGNEKTYDYLKRAGKTLKEQYETLKAGQKDPAEFEQKFKALEDNYKKALQEKDSAYQELQGKVSVAEKSSILNEVYAPLKGKFKGDMVNSSIFKSFEAQTKADVLKHSTIIEENGNRLLVATNAEGQPLQDSNLNYIPVEKVLQERFKEAIDEGRQQGGAGTGSAGKPHKGAESGIIRPAEADTKVKVSRFLKEKHPELKMGTKEYTTAWGELTEGLPGM